MKTSIYILLLSVGFGANSWAQIGGSVAQSATTDSNNSYYENNPSILNNYENPADNQPSAPIATVQTREEWKASKGIKPAETASKDDKKKSGASGCGSGEFGGANCNTTDAINMGVSQANKFIQTVGTAAVSNKSTSVQSDLAAKGASATNSEYLKGQADTADAAKKANNLAGTAQMMNAAVQGWRANEHRRSASSGIQDSADKMKDHKCSDQSMTADAIIACETAIQDKADIEIKAQKDKAVESAALAALTIEQGAASLEQANMAGKMADSLRQTAGNMGQGTVQFQLNAPTGGILDEGLAITAGTAPDAGGVVGDGAGAALDGGLKDFNPNANNNGVLGPTPGAFTDAKGSEGAGGAGPGLGGAGGTSASKDTGDGKQEATAGKSQTGGQFAAGEGGSAKFGRSGGSGSGVGFDTNFGDLLKKLLPGDDKKDAHASLDLNSDRSPASDQAAVMGRNKNIFFEISKRYQKKNNEGSVIFQ